MPGKEYLSKISMKDNSTVKTIYISDEEAKTELSNARGAYNNLDARLDDIESNTVPEHTSTQSGKALTVANDGSLVWATITGNTTYDLVDGNENGKVGLKNNSTGDVDYASVYGLGSAAYKSDSYFATSSDLEGYLSLYGTGTDSQSNNMKGAIRFGYNNSGTITSAEGLEFYTRTDSNYISSNRWSYGTTWDPLIDDGGKNYYGCAQIGYYNGGGTDVSGSTAADGSITILPYHLTSGQKPWDPDIGLTVKKDHVWIDGNELLSTAGRSLDKSNNTISLSDFAIDISDGDWNTDAVKTGWYCGSPNTQNAPTTSQQVKWWMGHVIAHDGGSQGIYLVQDLWNFSVDSTVTDMTGVPHYQRIRRYSGGTQTWTPWTQVKITDTTYSAGTGLTLGTGNVINHTDSVDAKDTLGMYKIKFNASGHITGSSAVSASDIKSLVSYTGGRFINVDSNNTINFAEDCIDISHTTGITSWNDVDKLGWYRATGLDDAPPSTSSTQWWMGHVIAHDGGSQGIYLVQDLWNFSIGGDSTYDVNKFPHYVRVRRLVNGVQTWTPWTKVVTSGIPLDGTGDDTKENNVKGRITFGYTETNGSTTTVTAGTGLNIYVKSNSANFNSFVKWSYGTTWGDEGSTTVYPALIGYHNGWTSSSSTAEDGFICIKPYPTTSAPWSGSVGLVVKKDHVYIDNNELIYSAGNHLAKSGTSLKIADYCKDLSVPSGQTPNDWNNVTTNGWYMSSNSSNAPTGLSPWWMGTVIAHNDDFVIQELWNFTATTDPSSMPHKFRIRKKFTSGDPAVWGEWTDIKFTDTQYSAGDGLTMGSNNTISHPATLTSNTKASTDIPQGFYKVGFNNTGHAINYSAVTASDISSLGVATTDENLKQEVSSADSNFSIVVSARTNSNTTPVTTTAHTVSNVYVHASDGKVYAPSFHGSIYGAINSSGTTYNIGSDSKDISGSSNSWNNATANGWYKGSSTTNAPSSDWYFGRTIAHSTTYTLQEVWQFNASNSDTDPLVVPYYVRLQRNGTWGQWKQVKFFQGLNTEINNLPTASGTVYADDYFVSQYANGGSTNTDYYRRPVIKLWDLFKGYITIGTSGSGNAVTSVSIANESGTNNRKITFTKGSTFLTSHQSVTDNDVTLAWSTRKTIATIGSTAIHVTLPSQPSGGTYYAGTGLSLSSSTFNHSNSVTARNSYTFCKIKYDSCGHIYDYTSVSASDIPDLSSYYSTTGHSHSTSVVNAGSAGSNYYCAVYCSEANGSSYTLYNYKGIRFRPRSGITDLLIGTNKQGSTNGITGSLYIFSGTYTGSIQVLPPSNGPSSDYGVYWPSSGGTLAITSSKSYDSSESMTKGGTKGSSPVLITDDNDKDHIIQNMTIRETAATLKIVFKDEQDKKPLYSIAEIPYLTDSDYDSAATIHMKEYDSKSGTYQVISTMITVSIEHNKEGTLTMTVSPVDETVQLPYIDSVYECD